MIIIFICTRSGREVTAIMLLAMLKLSEKGQFARCKVKFVLNIKLASRGIW